MVENSDRFQQVRAAILERSKLYIEDQCSGAIEDSETIDLKNLDQLNINIHSHHNVDVIEFSNTNGHLFRFASWRESFFISKELFISILTGVSVASVVSEPDLIDDANVVLFYREDIHESIPLRLNTTLGSLTRIAITTGFSWGLDKFEYIKLLNEVSDRLNNRLGKENIQKIGIGYILANILESESYE